MEKRIKGFEDYLVTDTGQVISTLFNKRRILKQAHNRKGYSIVRLGRRKTISVHRVVAQTFIPNPNNLPQVNHIDEDKTNNSVDNLEWCDAKYNNSYGTKNIRSSQTQRKNTHWILAEKNGNIVKFKTLTEASKKTGVSISCVSRVISGERKSAGGYSFRYDNIEYNAG